MNVTRDVVRDLLPLYVAGEASADTRAAVDAFLASDPELEALAASLREDAATEIARAPDGVLKPDRQALERTRQLLRRRTWLLASALFCTGFPFSFMFDDGGLRFLLIRDAPVVGSMCFAAAVILWIAYAITRRKMSVTGL
jgi:anti-sigma factor RsiW